MWMSLIQLVEGLHRTKRMMFPSERELLLPNWDTALFSVFRRKPNIGFSCLKPAGLRAGATSMILRALASYWNYTTGSPGPPT